MENSERIPAPAGLMPKARRAYEGGRVALAVLAAWPVPPMAAAAAWCCGGPTSSLVVGSLLLIGVVLLRWRGGDFGRAATAGMLAGLPPLLLPMFTLPMAARSGELACLAGYCLPLCLLACAAGGLLATVLLALRARSAQGGRGVFLLAGGAIAALTGGLGCVVMGGPGLIAMAAGAFAASPALVLAPRRSS